MTEAIELVYPETLHQTCIVHLTRASTAFVSHKDRKPVCNGLKPIIKPSTETALEAFDAAEAMPKWSAAMPQFAILFSDQFTRGLS